MIDMWLDYHIYSYEKYLFCAAWRNELPRSRAVPLLRSAGYHAVIPTSRTRTDFRGEAACSETPIKPS